MTWIERKKSFVVVVFYKLLFITYFTKKKCLEYQFPRKNKRLFMANEKLPFPLFFPFEFFHMYIRMHNWFKFYFHYGVYTGLKLRLILITLVHICQTFRGFQWLHFMFTQFTVFLFYEYIAIASHYRIFFLMTAGCKPVPAHKIPEKAPPIFVTM